MNAAQPAPLRLQRPQSLTDLATARLREAITSGALRLGAQVSESALAAQFGISKTPVREALLRLREEGLVEIHPQRGTYVFSITAEEVAEVCRFREVLELAALAEAMRNNHAMLVERLSANLKAMGVAHRARDTARLPALDADFHDAIMASCANTYLRAAYRLIEGKIHALRGQVPGDDDQIAHCQHNHALIATQIREGNVARAQAGLRAHIRDTLDAYVAASRRAALPVT